MASANELKKIYHSMEFLQMLPGPQISLGCQCGPGGTSFALWSPLAKHVTLLLYSSGTASACRRFPMYRDNTGVWHAEFHENLHGTYYLYELVHDSEPVCCADPYARACGLNGIRSMAVDLARTDPDGWDADVPPTREPETVIWETHVKEFSWQKAGGFPEEYRGKFKAFTCPETTLHSDGLHPTGTAYLRRLGVTHVQLMPIFDYGSVDETDPEAFNWGYDPVNYNVPEGSYSTDPAHGAVRIRECKEMIQALHRSGLRVIMDVVYNHTYRLDSCFNRTVPWYYYRVDASGVPSDGSACGNDFASEEPMCANYILNSVLYWASEYHVDGFRFDLMGLMDLGLMNRIRSELDRIYGKGEKILLGEPWAAGPTAAYQNAILAQKPAMKLLSPGIAMFSDDTRDAIKGNVFERTTPGYINGGKNLEASVLHAVCGWSDPPAMLLAPSQHICYLSAHDNLTLWDKLTETVPDVHDRMACNRLAGAILLCCQGIPFFLSGEEFGRTKNGLDNTYRDSIELNRLDWEQAWKNRRLHRYYAGLIALRRQCPGLCDKSANAWKRIRRPWLQNGAIRFYVNNVDCRCTCRWKKLCIILNARSSPLRMFLPKGGWQLLVSEKDSYLWKNSVFRSGPISVAPHSVQILGQES